MRRPSFAPLFRELFHSSQVVYSNAMNMRQFFRVVEIRTKIISMGTFLTAALYTYQQSGLWSWTNFTLMATAVLAVDMGTTGFNSYFDYRNGTDQRETNFEGDKVLVHENGAPTQALFISLALFGLASLLGLILAWRTSLWLLVPGVISFLIGFAYTGGPYPISRTPLGELFAGGFLGTVLFLLTYFVLTKSITWNALLASLPIMVVIGMILSVNNSCDLVSDTIAQRRTLSILLGPQAAPFLLTAELLLAYLLLLLFSLLGTYPRPLLYLAPISALFSGYTLLKMIKRGFSLHTKGLSMQAVSQIYLLLIASISGASALALFGL
jgi:1,4-dihydroxy-2-naphthoate octaprenyltransferase